MKFTFMDHIFKYEPDRMNQTAFLRSGTYLLEIISSSLRKGLVN